MHADGRIEDQMDKLSIEKNLVDLITKDHDEFHKFFD